jgi:hypothetical protein
VVASIFLVGPEIVMPLIKLIITAGFATVEMDKAVTANVLN